MRTIILMVLCEVALSKTYRCEFNSAPPGKSLNSEELKEFVREIEFESDQKEGKLLTFKNHKVFIWNKNNFINTKYQDTTSNFEFTTSYLPLQESFFFNVSPHHQFKCSLKKSSTTPMPDTQGDMALQKENLFLSIYTDLKFIYYQAKANDRMRAIIFQEGLTYSLDSEREKDKEWCIFNIQVKLDEDTLIPKGTKIKVVGFNLLSNNPNHNVYAYDFVDIAQGKKVSETSRYVPFSLECKIAKDKILTPEYFKKITGNRLSLGN